MKKKLKSENYEKSKTQKDGLLAFTVGNKIYFGDFSVSKKLREKCFFLADKESLRTIINQNFLLLVGSILTTEKDFREFVFLESRSDFFALKFTFSKPSFKFSSLQEKLVIETKKDYFLQKSDLVSKKVSYFSSTKNLRNYKIFSFQKTKVNKNSGEVEFKIEGCCFFPFEKKKLILNLNDHRKLGRELEIFTFHDSFSQGSPVLLPKGTIIKQLIHDLIFSEETKNNYFHVQTPFLVRKEIYQISGHLEHYKDFLFPMIKTPDGEELFLRAMTCPQHCLVYKLKKRSYDDLPLRFAEHSYLFRYEESGALRGLERVRVMQMPDAHIFLTEEQLVREIRNCYNLITNILKKLGLKCDYLALSLHDSKKKTKYSSDDDYWRKTENAFRNSLNQLKIPFFEEEGEAAFYGPKLDFQIKTTLGHNITLATIQVDFLLAKKFNLVYNDKDNEEKTPVMIHRSVIGTYERAISFILEQNNASFPFWLAPVQVQILPVAQEERIVNYCLQIEEELKNSSFRVFTDKRRIRISKKIREGQLEKIPIQVVVGEQEVTTKSVSVRVYGNNKQTVFNLVEFKLFLKRKQEEEN